MLNPTLTLAHMDACELLDADHMATKHLFVEYARLSRAMPQESADQRTELAQAICRALDLHARQEEEVFYPALREAQPAAAALLDEALAEHAEVRQMVGQLESLATADDEMDELVEQLAAAVEHHVKEERDRLFPMARASGLDLEELAGRLLAASQAATGTS